ncbi:hypothetical protein BCR44DRAFT_55522 [Catenaria anguillulae PL171]|uniref:RRM domain-containing protein n=1 Tax=Catenaria anguillulae PL171 TaxID=765915 RepID=A0A1Y2HSR5_9FUNG|nr:hypothetical protein BCR44DRAFT_55522 [Catenaria anguillulae PL171]
MTASPNLNGAQPAQPAAPAAAPQADASSASGSTSVQPTEAQAQQAQQQQGQGPPHVQPVQYAPHQGGYPMMPAPMAVYQGYPGTHPGAYMAAAPHFAPPGTYPMYPAGAAGAPGAQGQQQQGGKPVRGMSPSSASMHSGQGAGSVADRPKTTLWMGIDSWMDENYIRSLWMNAAGVEVTVKMIRDRYTGGTANYCFVDFPTPEHAANCAKFDGTPIPTLPESTWRLNWAAGGGLNDTKAPEYSIFVGDLAADITDDMLMSAFKSRYPSTKTAKVVMDPGTGNSRGFGFVRFTAEEEQQRALAEMTGQHIGSRAVRVGHAAPKHAHRHQNNHPGGNNVHHGGPNAHHHHNNHHGGHQGGHRGGHFNSHHHNPHHGGHHHQGGWNNNPNAQANSAAAAAAAAADPSNTTVFIGGLSHPVTEDEIRSMFSALGEITLVKIPHNKNCAFVSYARRDSAEKAIAELNGFPLGNNKVRLSWGRPNANNGGAPGGNPHHQGGHHHHQGHYGQQGQQFQQGPPGAAQGAQGYAGNAAYAAAGQFGAAPAGFAPTGFPNAGAPGYVADGQAAAGGAPGYYPGYYNGAAPAGGAGAPATGAAREGGADAGTGAAAANGEGSGTLVAVVV